MTALKTMPDPVVYAANLLSQGELVGMPTETVYGLAGDATDPLSIAKIYAMKGRPSFNPLIIHGYSLEQLEDIAVFDERARAVAQAFWPGPVTLVLRRHPHCPVDLLASGGLETVAVRIPQHPIALSLLKTFGKPIVAPSANLSNHLSPTTPDMVRGDFPKMYVLDGGNATIGLESTILDLTSETPVILRPGGVAMEDLETLLGKVTLYDGQAVLAPGMTKKHYAPRSPLRINAKDKQLNEILIGFGDTPDADLNLSSSGDLVEAAANLYTMLHLADEMIAQRRDSRAGEFAGIEVEKECRSARTCDSEEDIQINPHLSSPAGPEGKAPYDADTKPLLTLEKHGVIRMGIAVAPIPSHGLGLAINDRLSRGVWEFGA